MAEIRLDPIAQEEGVGRGVFSGGMGGAGFGGDDCLCGHCDTVMFEDFNPYTLLGDLVFQCSVCSEFSERPRAEAFPESPLEDSEDLPPEDTWSTEA
jgi:hypothetical protein